MKAMNLISYLIVMTILISLSSTTVFAEALEQGNQVSPSSGHSYGYTTFSQLETNSSGWNGKYITLNGYYDKETNLFKESETSEFGLKIISTPQCYMPGVGRCVMNSSWMSIDGLFTYDASYNLEAELILLGKYSGNKCIEDAECISKFCLLCPNMKMLLAGYINYTDLPSNANKIDFAVPESSFYHQGSVIVINPAPSYGYCAGLVLPTEGPNTEEYINKVHQAYIDNDILEEDEPFVWGPATFQDDGGGGYCIGTWNNNKYKWILAKSGDEQYIDLAKDAFLAYVSEDYFNNHIKLISVSKLIVFSYTIGEYSFPLIIEVDVNNTEIQVQQLKEIETVIPKDQAFNKLKTECLSNLEETNIMLDNNGSILMDGRETIEEDTCKFGRLNLQTGEILECIETACYLSSTSSELTQTYRPSADVSNLWISNLWIYITSAGIIILIIVSVILLKKRKT